jgi:membrane protease YdiL (CAAX protease family)
MEIGSILISLLFLGCDYDMSDGIDFKNPGVGNLIYGMGIGPLFETWLFQFLPLKLSKFLHIKFCWPAIIVSAAFFASAHPHNPEYLTLIFFHGVILASLCLLFIKKKKHPILYTALVHAVHNVLVFTVNFFTA